MAQYVTREEYERLTARLAEIERNTAVNVTVSASGRGDERIRDLVREGIAQAADDQRRGGFSLGQARYASQKG